MCSPSADFELAPPAAPFGGHQLKQPLQNGGSGHVEGEGDEEIGEIGGGGVTSFPRKGGVGRRIGDVGIGRRKTQKKILKSAQTHCRVLLVGAGKVRQRIPEGWEETKDEDGQQTRESEIGSPVLHLFK